MILPAPHLCIKLGILTIIKQPNMIYSNLNRGVDEYEKQMDTCDSVNLGTRF